MDDVDHRVRALWRDVADTPDGFSSGLSVVVSDRHRASPPGWVGIVRLGDSTVVATPSRWTDRVQRAIDLVGSEQFDLSARVTELLHPTATLGPALLFYGAPMQRLSTQASVEPIEFADARLHELFGDVTAAERDEAGLDEFTAGLHLATDRDARAVSVAGWATWPQGVAHIGVLTRRSARGHGHAAAVGAVAVEAASGQGLLPQWRAAHTNEASIAVARRLGLQELGWQYSLELRGS